MCTDAGTSVNGGQTVLNPWVIVGGVASAVCTADECVMPWGGKVGDVVVLTTPLGPQLAVNAHQWLSRPDRLARVSKQLCYNLGTYIYICVLQISEFVTRDEIVHTYRFDSDFYYYFCVPKVTARRRD